MQTISFQNLFLAIPAKYRMTTHTDKLHNNPVSSTEGIKLLDIYKLLKGVLKRITLLTKKKKSPVSQIQFYSMSIITQETTELCCVRYWRHQARSLRKLT